MLSTVIYDLDSRITAKYSKYQTSFYPMQVSFCFHSLRCSENFCPPIKLQKKIKKNFQQQTSIGVYQSTHALTPSLSHTHIHRPSVSYTAPPRTVSATCAASRCAPSSAATTSSPALLIAAQCKGSCPSACARADSRQCQHTTHPVSQKYTQKAKCSYLLPLCESVMRPSS